MKPLVIAAAMLAIAAGARAQTPKPKTLDDVVAHGAAAEKALEHNALLGSVAEQLSHACEKYAADHNISAKAGANDRVTNLITAIFYCRMRESMPPVTSRPLFARKECRLHECA